MRPALAVAAVVAGLVAGPGIASQPEPTTGTANAVEALAADLARHPMAEADDVYKFLHQALFGPGHAIPDADAAARYLQRELEELGPQINADTLCDTLGGDPVLVRVNLRPFVARGFDAGTLLESFIAAAEGVRGDPEQMGVALDLVVRWLQTEGTGDLAQALQKRASELERQGYPSIHHSPAYVQIYLPAYRVVEASAAAAHGWCGSTF